MEFLCNPFNDTGSPWYYVVGVAVLLLIFAALAVYIVIENRKKKKNGAEASADNEQSAAPDEAKENTSTEEDAQKDAETMPEEQATPVDGQKLAEEQAEEKVAERQEEVAEEAIEEETAQTEEEKTAEEPTQSEAADAAAVEEQKEEVTESSAEEETAARTEEETAAAEERAAEEAAEPEQSAAEALPPEDEHAPEAKTAEQTVERGEKAEQAAAVDVLKPRKTRTAAKLAVKRSQKPKKSQAAEDENKICTVKKVETVTDENGKKLRYNRSFEAIIIQSDDKVKDYYSELKNSLMAFTDVSTRMSRTRESYNVGKRNCAARLTVRRNKLCMMIDADPKQYAGGAVEDMSDRKSYAKTPCLCRIDDDESKARAVEIIENALSDKYERADVQKTDYRPKYESTQALVERELIREKEVIKKQK